MANGLNTVFLLGNLGNDPELRQTAGGPVLKLRVATTEKWKDRTSGELREKTEWHNVNYWGARAEGLSGILKKGDRVMVEGRVETTSSERDGVKRYFTDINARDVYLTTSGPRREVAVPAPAPTPAMNTRYGDAYAEQPSLG